MIIHITPTQNKKENKILTPEAPDTMSLLSCSPSFSPIILDVLIILTFIIFLPLSFFMVFPSYKAFPSNTCAFCLIFNFM